ncbi:MAG: hypothetical protein RL497_674 [Pseudomonadota bacterium]|jgi:hypothetical protein
MNLSIAIANIIIAFAGLYLSLKQHRLGTVVWFLISYFMLWFIPVALTDEITHIQKFTNGTIKIDQESIGKTLIFILAFNIIFFISDIVFYRMHRASIHIPIAFKWGERSNITQCVFILFLLYGTIFYYLSTRNFSYTDYVENVASWPMVFMWCASSGICLAALRKKYVIASLMALPFLYFMIHLKIRSFALLSIIPLLIILYLQFSEGQQSFLKNWRTYAVIIPIFIGLLFGAAYSMNTKQDKARNTSIFPDAGMPFGCIIITEGIRKDQISTGFDALKLYGSNISNPFRRLFGMHTPEIIDPPVIMAQIFEGFPKNHKTRYHYPVLWYTDAYLAFGLLGLLLAVFWSAVLNFWERLASYNASTFCILLPVYCWHAYMLVRGAISGAAVPFLYSVYIAAIVFMTIDYSSLIKRYRRPTSLSPQPESKKSALFVTATHSNKKLSAPTMPL